MALNMKVTLVTCVVVIVGFCWIVDRVARPIVELAAPPVVALPPASGSGGVQLVGDVRVPARPTTSLNAVRERETAPAFANASPVERPALRDEGGVAGADNGRLSGSFGGNAEAAGDGVLANSASRIDSTEADPDALQRAATPAAIATATPARAEEELLVPEIALSESSRRPRGLLSATWGSTKTAKPGAPAYESYEVQKGDSLLKIMRRAWHTDDRRYLAVLVHFNPALKGRENSIRIGEELRIPAKSVADEHLAQRGTHEGDDVVARDAGAPTHFRWYEVRPKDSLIGIARRLLNDGSRWREIAELNALKNANMLAVGMRIKIPLDESETYPRRAAR